MAGVTAMRDDETYRETTPNPPANPSPAAFPFRAVLSDVDGTLLDANREVSGRTAAAIRALNAADVPFALVTGRMPSGIEVIRRAFGIPMPAVCYSGALVVDAENRPIASTTLSGDEASFVMGLVADSFPQLATNYFAGLDWFVDDASHPAVQREISIVKARPERVDLAGVLSAGRLPNKLFFVCADDPSRSLDLVARIREGCPGVNVIRSSDGVMVEVLPAGVDKASGTLSLLKALGVERRDALFFGNDANDVPLLRAAGRGVAVGDAAPCAQEAADDVAPASIDDGVARYLEGLGLRGA